MSIREWIKNYTGVRLFPLEPIMPAALGSGATPIARRHVFMSEEVRALVEGPWPNGRAGQRCADLRAELEGFVDGAEIGVCVRPYEAAKGNAQFGLLDPIDHGVWDYRSGRQSPAIRLLGHFAATDCFIALVPASRSRATDFIRLGPLADRNSDEWKHAIEETHQLWRRLFPHHSPLVGDDASVYFSGNYHLV